VNKSTALVTGATTGIGLELARILASEGHELVLAARSVERLEDVARELRERGHASVSTHARDLSEPGAADALFRELTDDGISVDVLVNNAGAGLHGAFVTQDPDAIDRRVALNVSALTTLTRLVLPGMLARRSGRILNVASVVAYQPGGPYEAVYYATKTYVLSFSRGLDRELAGSGVTVTVLCPGPTHTAFEASAGATGTALYEWVPTIPAAAVARAGYLGMMRGKKTVIPGLAAKLIAFAGQLPPRWLALELNRLLLKPPTGARR
jgi:uncharacterized protein